MPAASDPQSSPKASFKRGGVQKLSEFKQIWHKGSLNKEPSDRGKITACVKQLYESFAQSPPTIVWCESPWQLTVLPVMLDLMLSSCNHEQLEVYLRSKLSADLCAQNHSLWKQVCRQLHGVLEGVLEGVAQERRMAGIGEDLNWKFNQKRAKDLQNLCKEHSKVMASTSVAKLKNEVSEICQRELCLDQAARAMIVKTFSCYTAAELTGQFEYTVRESAKNFFKVAYLKDQSASSTANTTIDSQAVFTAFRLDARFEAQHNYLVHQHLIETFKRISWGEWCINDYLLCAFIRACSPDHKWSKKRNGELKLWSTLAQETNGCLFFQNFCFVAGRPRDYSINIHPGTTVPADCSFSDKFSFKANAPSKLTVEAFGKLPVKVLPKSAAKKDMASSKDAVDSSAPLPKPIEIKNWLDQRVIGQEEAKKVLAVAVYQHYNRIKKLSISSNKNNLSANAKSNILLVGPTGSGKTMLAQSLAALLSVPIAIVDATGMSQRGYVGGKVEDMIKSLYHASNRDIKATQTGIIFIDEIDKLKASRDGSLDVAGEGVQQNLLKLIEGNIVSFEESRDGRKIFVDTSNILFIASGAFSHIDQIVKERKNSRNGSNIGLGVKNTGLDKTSAFNELLREINGDDLIKFGMIPELIGRLPVIAVLEELTVDLLMAAITHSKNSLFNQYSEMLKCDNIEFELHPDAARCIAEEAQRRGTGARGLRAIFEKIMLDLMFELPSKQDVKKVVIDLKLLRKFLPAAQLKETSGV